MTVLAAPYALLRRDGEALVSRADPPRRAAEPPLPAGPERRHGLLRSEVARLIAERNFTVAFQPVVRLADRRPVSHEALLRLRPGPGAPNLPTRMVVDAAQDWDLGAALDLAVLDVALAAWPRTAATPVSVNICARSLRDPVFLARLLTRISRDGTTIAIELTGIHEDADIAAVGAMVPALRAVGVRVVLDDFSAADACLGCMQAAQFDEVKVAGAMLGEAVAGPRGQKLLRAMVALADTSGARCVAKMIETEQQAALMTEIGVQYGQGWLFGAPEILQSERRRTARPMRGVGNRHESA